MSKAAAPRAGASAGLGQARHGWLSCLTAAQWPGMAIGRAWEWSGVLDDVRLAPVVGWGSCWAVLVFALLMINEAQAVAGAVALPRFCRLSSVFRGVWPLLRDSGGCFIFGRRARLTSGHVSFSIRGPGRKINE